MSNDNISSNWNSFRQLWVLVAMILFILLLLLWLLGFGPLRDNCQAHPQVIEKVVDSPELLSRISLLETENLKIPSLMTTINSLQNGTLINELTGKINHLKEQLDADKEVISVLKSKLRLISSTDDGAKVAALMSKIDILETESTDVTTLKTKISELEAKEKELSELKEKFEKITEKAAAFDSQKVEISDLSAKIKALQEDNAKIGVLKDRVVELETANKEISILQAKIKMLSSDSEKNADSQGSEVQIKNLDIVNTKVIDLQNQIKRLKAQNEMIPELQAKINTLQIVKSKAAESTTEKTPVAVAVPKKVIKVSPRTLPAVAKLYFKIGRSRLPTDPKHALPRVISYLKKHKSAKVVLSGFHDRSGRLSSNQALSLRRAKAVRKLLLRAGISVKRIKLAKPAKSEGTGSPKEARRVEVKVVDK